MKTDKSLNNFDPLFCIEILNRFRNIRSGRATFSKNIILLTWFLHCILTNIYNGFCEETS